MATERQNKANRHNAQASTGPKTDQGKQVARLNALRHGLCAQDVLLPDEDPQDFEDLYTALVNELRPSTALEESLFNMLVSKLWRLRRVGQIETEILQNQSKAIGVFESRDIAGTLGRAFTRTVDDNEMLTKVQRYETTLESGIYRVLGQLRDLQANRIEAPDISYPAIQR